MKFTREILGLMDFMAECFIVMPTSWVSRRMCFQDRSLLQKSSIAMISNSRTIQCEIAMIVPE